MRKTRNQLMIKHLPLCSMFSRSYWIPGSYAPSIVREAQLLFKAIEKEGLQGGKGANNWVVRHRQIPRPWNPTRATYVRSIGYVEESCACRPDRDPRGGASARPPA